MAVDEPATFEEAQMNDSWRAAIDEELHNHATNGTWEVVVPPAGANLVDTKWIFKLKADGRHKARLVARGFSQQRGIDWHESYAPVTSTLVLRLLCHRVPRSVVVASSRCESSVPQCGRGGRDLPCATERSQGSCRACMSGDQITIWTASVRKELVPVHQCGAYRK